MANKIDNPIAELGRVLSGESLERMADILAEPEADFGAGELARIGAAFTQIGAGLTAAAKTEAGRIVIGGVGKDGYYADGGAVFKWRRGYESVRVDSAAVKRLFPPSEYPELYKTTTTRDSIAVTL